MISCQTDDAGLTLPSAGSAGKRGSAVVESGGTGDTGVGGTLAQAGTDESGGGHDETTAGTGGGTSSGGKGGTGGSSATHSTGGSHSTGGTHASSGGSDANGTGGTADTGPSSEAGAGGELTASAGAGNTMGQGGTSGMGGTAGMSGMGGTGNIEPAKLCLFHSPPSVVGGGEGGAAPAPNGVALATNAFIGQYLTDLAGMTLYVYGADFPGDCNTPPVTNCTADCLQSWPVFDAGERQLASTLDDGVFGTIDRGGGVFQTTYYGWPLYRYKSDTAANTINGQGKSKTWFAAEIALPNLMIMRGPVSGGGVKYLSDDHGHTLYSLSGDTLGGPGVEPKSTCTDACADAFMPYAPGAVYPVTSIEPHDVALFFHADGSLQTAYKGAPLYYAKSDLASGQTNGLNLLFGAALVTP